jgi:predicted phosphodiesterase
MASKKDQIKSFLKSDPTASTKEVAIKFETSARYVRATRKEMWEDAKAMLPKDEPKDSIVGFFTDTHMPSVHPRFFEFVKDTFRAHGVNKVVCGGDLVDHHFISRHVSEPDALNPIDELELAKKELKKWVAEFPKVKVCRGNHDAIPTRQAKELGIPKHFLKGLNELYDLPDTWEWADQWEIDGVMYEHGLGAGGMYGFKQLALAYGQSVVTGHTHSNGGVLYVASPNRILFGANGGCGMDVEGYAGRYGKNYKYKPTLGCVIVKNGKEATFVPMDMEKYSRHNK